MSGIKIIQCTCEHEFQDKTYGKKNRLHNKLQSTGSTEKYRCTVCGKEK